MVKNVNKEWFKKIKKGITLVVTTVMITVSLSGCLGHFIHKPSNAQPSNSNSSYTYTYDGSSDTLRPYGFETSNSTTHTDEEKNQLLDVIVSFSDLDTSRMYDLIRSYHVSYPHSDLYNTRAALDRYYGMTEYDSTHTLRYITNGRINEDALRETIKANTREYLSNRTGTRYTELSDADFEYIFKAMVETLNLRLGTVDIYQLDDNLSHLILTDTTNSGYGSVEDDTVHFALNVQNIRRVGGDVFLREVTAHETNHLSQISSTREKGQEGYYLNRGLYYEWQDFDVNPLAYQWFIEASAERLAQTEVQEDKDHTVYKEWVKDLDSMSLTAIMLDDFNHLTVPQLSTQGNLDELFAFFHAETREEKEEVINMMFALEIKNRENKPFYNSLPLVSKDNYVWSIRPCVGMTLTKNFYYNLTTALQTKPNITLNDVFTLLVYEESDLNRVVRYSKSDSRETQQFLDMYNTIQGEFFEMLSRSTGLSVNELYNLYDEFFTYQTKLSSDTNLLSPEEQAFLDNISDVRLGIMPDDNLFTYKK